MKINDEGTSNAAHWYERAMKAEARLAEADAHGKAQQRWAHEWRDKHDALTAENAALRKDAERYRWLRASYDRAPPGVFHPAWGQYMGGNQWKTLEQLDAAIDAAMQEGER
jgi:hypothetical protein